MTNPQKLPVHLVREDFWEENDKMALKDVWNEAFDTFKESGFAGGRETDQGFPKLLMEELLNNPICYSPDVCFHYSHKPAGKLFMNTSPSKRNSLSNFARGCYLSYLAHASVVTIGNNRHKNAMNPQLAPVWCHHYSDWDEQEQSGSACTNTWFEDSKWIKGSLIFNFWRRKLSSVLKMTEGK